MADLLPVERCMTHHGNIVKKYCADHNVVCCDTCNVVRHRSCTHVDTLRHVGRGIKTTVEYKKSKDSIDEILSRMKQERNVRNKNLTIINQQKEKLMKDVDTFQDEIIDKIKELVKTSKRQILSKHEEYKKVMQEDQAALETVIASTTNTLKNLSSYSEARVFANVKATKNRVNEGDSLLNGLSDEWINRELRFSFNRGLKDKIISLGHIVESVKECKAELFGRYTVNKDYGNITGVCVLDNGTLLIVEHSEARLMRLSETFRVKDSIPLDGQPEDLCRVGETEVAICLGNTEKVQFASIGEVMEPSHSFVVGKGCNGIAFNESNGEIFVCYSTRVGVYNKAGSVLRSYEEAGRFSCLWHIAVSIMKENVFVTDNENGLIMLNREGNKVWSFTDPDLQGARAICLLPGDLVLVAGVCSNNILQIDNDGRKEGMLVAANGLKRPLAMAYDKENSRIIIGCGSNEIVVYSISRK